MAMNVVAATISAALAAGSFSPALVTISDVLGAIDSSEKNVTRTIDQASADAHRANQDFHNRAAEEAKKVDQFGKDVSGALDKAHKQHQEDADNFHKDIQNKIAQHQKGVDNFNQSIQDQISLHQQNAAAAHEAFQGEVAKADAHVKGEVAKAQQQHENNVALVDTHVKAFQGEQQWKADRAQTIVDQNVNQAVQDFNTVATMNATEVPAYVADRVHEDINNSVASAQYDASVAQANAEWKINHINEIHQNNVNQFNQDVQNFQNNVNAALGL